MWIWGPAAVRNLFHEEIKDHHSEQNWKSHQHFEAEWDLENSLGMLMVRSRSLCWNQYDAFPNNLNCKKRLNDLTWINEMDTEVKDFGKKSLRTPVLCPCFSNILVRTTLSLNPIQETKNGGQEVLEVWSLKIINWLSISPLWGCLWIRCASA